MQLYHYTSRHHIEGCLREGIRLGGILQSFEPPLVKRGYQWLTESAEWDQSWDSMREIPYPRNAYRVRANIPRRARHKLIRWDENWASLTTEQMAKTLSSHGDPHNWFVFKGVVRPQWFEAVERNPSMDTFLPDLSLDAQPA